MVYQAINTLAFLLALLMVVWFIAAIGSMRFRPLRPVRRLISRVVWGGLVGLLRLVWRGLVALWSWLLPTYHRGGPVHMVAPGRVSRAGVGREEDPW